MAPNGLLPASLLLDLHLIFSKKSNKLRFLKIGNVFKCRQGISGILSIFAPERIIKKILLDDKIVFSNNQEIKQGPERN